MSNEYSRIYGMPKVAQYPTGRRMMTFGRDIQIPNPVWDAKAGRVVHHDPVTSADRRRYQPQTGGYYPQNSRKNRVAISLDTTVRLNCAIVFLMALFVLLGCFTLLNRADCMKTAKALEVQKHTYAVLMEENAKLTEEYDTALEDIRQIACDDAHKMINANDSKNAIYLVAVDAYPQNAGQQGYTAEVVPLDWYAQTASNTTYSASAAD